MTLNLKRQISDLYWRASLSRTANAVRARGLTYLRPDKLASLENFTRRLDETQVEGLIVEFGIALGGSSIVIAKQMGPGRSYWGYDVFDTIPPPSERDGAKEHERYNVITSGKSRGIGSNVYYGYEANLYDKVKQNFADFGIQVDDRRVRLIKGLFAETVSFDADQMIALAHIDCDWHDPVAFCLKTIYPYLSKEGVIILDDYNDYGGCRIATDAFLESHKDIYMVATTPHAVLVRRA